MKYMHYNEKKNRGTAGFPIELYHINSSHPQYTMPLHWHVEPELIRVLDGTFYLTLNDTKMILAAGDIVFVNSGVLHCGTAENCVYDCLVFSYSMLTRQGQACHEYLEQFRSGALAVKPFQAAAYPELYKTAWDLFDCMAGRQPGFELGVHGRLLLLLWMFYRDREELLVTDSKLRSHRQLEQLKKVLLLIEDSYDTALSLEDMAKTAGMSRKYFCRFFREMTQRTPVDYLNYHRIERACYLMISSNLTVTEIAYACGFRDLSYFIRTFKKYKGTTPKRYVTAFLGLQKANGAPVSG